jgi:hypothetical protein
MALWVGMMHLLHDPCFPYGTKSIRNKTKEVTLQDIMNAIANGVRGQRWYNNIRKDDGDETKYIEHTPEVPVRELASVKKFSH